MAKRVWRSDRPFARLLLGLAVLSATLAVVPASPAGAATIDLTTQSVVSQNFCESNNSWRTGDYIANGNNYPRSRWCEINRDPSVGWQEFDLGQAYVQFRALAGTADTSQCEGLRARFEVIGDGVTLLTKGVGYGGPSDINVNTAGVLRLRLQVTKLDGDTACDGFAAWLNPKLSTTGGLGPPQRFPVVPVQTGVADTSDDVATNFCDSNNSWRTTARTIVGTTYSPTLSCLADRSASVGWQEYPIFGRYRVFEATVGLDSASSSADDRHRVRVFDDVSDVALADVTVGLTDAIPIAVYVRGVLRVRIQAEVVSNGGDGITNSTVVLGDPRFTPRVAAIAMVDSGGRLWSNLGHDSSGFVRRAGGVTDMALTDDRMVIVDTGSQRWVKEDNPVQPWSRIARGARFVEMAGDLILMIDNGWNLWVKEGGLNAPWQRIARGVAQVKADGNRIVMIDRGNQVWAKDGAIGAA